MSSVHQHNKSAIKVLCKTLYDFDEQAIRHTLLKLLRADAVCHFSYPLGDVPGNELFDEVFAPLATALPDVERRDVICLAGPDQHGAEWVGCAGHYVGRFMTPYLGIPPTGHIAHIRFHEFFRFCGGQVTEILAIWDLPEVMMQAGVWPMGHHWAVNGMCRPQPVRMACSRPQPALRKHLQVFSMWWIC